MSCFYAYRDYRGADRCVLRKEKIEIGFDEYGWVVIDVVDNDTHDTRGRLLRNTLQNVSSLFKIILLILFCIQKRNNFHLIQNCHVQTIFLCSFSV